MARSAAVSEKEASREDAISPVAMEAERLRRKAALDRLWGIGWMGDLEAMRLGDEDHRPS